MQKNKIKVGYFCLQNPENKRVWSGTHYSLMKSIESADFQVVNLSPIVFPRVYHRLLGIYNRLHRFFSKKFINEEFTFLSAIFSKIYLKNKIKNEKIDILFAPASSAQISLINKDIPIIFFNDTTIDQLKNYYPNYKSFSCFSLKEASILQELALKKSSKIIFPSRWALDFAVQYYNIPKSKVKETRLGANLPILNELPNKKFSEGINFIFSGVSWERKGGNLVINTIDKLIKKGHKVNLFCMGVKPPVEREYLKYLGFLDKNKEDDVKLMLEIYLKSHFMFVPSSEECYGIVFSEASAYGIISVSRKTGGIPSVIKHGENGFLFDKEAAVDDYVNFFEKLFSNSIEMNSMFLKSYNYYQENLNWYVFSQTFLECYNEIIFGKK